MADVVNNVASEDIDKNKAARIIKWLITVESENDKTGSLTDGEMIHKIAKHIQGEAKCL